MILISAEITASFVLLIYERLVGSVVRDVNSVALVSLVDGSNCSEGVSNVETDFKSSDLNFIHKGGFILTYIIM